MFAMKSKTFSVPNISCDHCVMSIKTELSAIEGVTKVTGSADTKNITVEWDSPATLESLKSTLKEINYPAEE
jgi:copper chaperone CopZ